MIKLSGTSVTTIQYLSGTNVLNSAVTDTLYVQSVNIDFRTGALYATIARGTVVNGVFEQNYPSVSITVNPDGTFISSDSKWAGTLANVSALVAQLKSQFDGFIVSSNLVTGTAV